MGLVEQIFKEPSSEVLTDIIKYTGVSTKHDIYLVLNDLIQNPHNQIAKEFILWDTEYYAKIRKALEESYSQQVLDYLRWYITRKDKDIHAICFANHLFREKDELFDFFASYKALWIAPLTLERIREQVDDGLFIIWSSVVSAYQWDPSLYMNFSIAWFFKQPLNPEVYIKYLSPNFTQVQRKESDAITDYLTENFPNDNYFTLCNIDPKTVP